MAVYELKAAIAPSAVEALEELLMELADQRLMVLEDKPSGQAWLAGYFESSRAAGAAWKRLAGTTNAGWSTVEPELRAMPDVDWKNSYRIHFKASKFGRLNWVPVWERESFALAAGEEVLWLDPGLAFGTGNHETTRLCCERLADYAARRGNAGVVIDAGCGSGILALSAAKLGFQQIAGFDVDPEAIRVSGDNAGANGLTGRVDFFVGDLVAGLAGRQAALLLANIQADILMRFADNLCLAVAPGGELVLSGILSHEIDAVQGKFAGTPRAWQVESRVLGEWADLRFSG